MTVYWSVLMERAILEPAVMGLLRVAEYSAVLGYRRMYSPYGRTDATRNSFCKHFAQLADDPNDVLVMLDCDHVHPENIVEQLTRFPADMGVVCGLNYHRQAAPVPMMFDMTDGKHLDLIVDFEPGEIIECDFAAPCAVAIRRWVLDKLEYPYWRYLYGENPKFDVLAEDYWFGKICYDAGIPHFVDTALTSPHLKFHGLDYNDWMAYKAQNEGKFTTTGTDEYKRIAELTRQQEESYGDKA